IISQDDPVSVNYFFLADQPGIYSFVGDLSIFDHSCNYLNGPRRDEHAQQVSSMILNRSAIHAKLRVNEFSRLFYCHCYSYAAQSLRRIYWVLHMKSPANEISRSSKQALDNISAHPLDL